MRKTRVLVVEDSLTVRRHIVDVLSADPQLEVIGETDSGLRAIELVRSLRPDIVTLDMALASLTGLEATEQIMAHMPTPILIVSSSTNRGEAFNTFDALTAGAVDVLEKPAGTEIDGAWERKLVDAVKMAARIRVITHIRGRLRGAPASPPTTREVSVSRTWPHPTRLIAIGASTGGPGAVAGILRDLPADFSIPILLVIHLAEGFAQCFADWLGVVSSFPVRIAQDGDPLPAPGQRGVVMAPPDRHLSARNGRLRLERTAERNFCRPSVDVLFESLAGELASSTAACLLTGMGRDGAAGLLAIRTAGGLTIAESQATAIVFGMPREAVERNAAVWVLPLPEIAHALAARRAG